MAQLGAQAAFLSAGGYHHHVGANTWESAGAPPAPPGTAALRQATIVLPDAAPATRRSAGSRRQASRSKSGKAIRSSGTPPATHSSSE